MFHFVFNIPDLHSQVDGSQSAVGGTRAFWITKRLFDIVVSALLVPPTVVFALVLIIVNPIWNRGPVFFLQQRMGKDCQPFTAFKFRTMDPTDAIQRGHNDPIEHPRITRLGRFLRKTRIDELPQIHNVLNGDMSLVGPRPDYLIHAETYLTLVPGYRERHSIRPGISGLAQVQLGYVESIDATKDKTSADLYYIRNAGFWLELRIVLHTIYTVIMRSGT